MKIYTIYGPAGTGKTEYLASIIKDTFKINKNIVICASTHSSVENLYNRLSQIPKTYFKTIYSFFRIDYENDDVIGPINNVNYVFIDEFGLIKKELFKKMISKLEKTCVVYISGDVIQLNPIYLEKRYISFTCMKKHYLNDVSYVIEHDYNNVFSTKLIRESEKTLLTQNKRSNDIVMEIIHKIFYSNNEFKFPLINILNVINLILTKNYVLISSKYEYLNNIYSILIKSIKYERLIQTHGQFKQLAFYKDAKYIISDTLPKRNLYNGEILVFSHISGHKIFLNHNDEIIEYDNEIQLLPSFLITAHKSQGMSINNVIVCLDELFDISMLYTMITRARYDVKFFVLNTLNSNLNNEISKFKEIMKFYNYI